jgi:endonuclease YncB( thermonuclease family)
MIMFRFLLYFFLLTLSWPLYAATLTGKVVKIADGDTITVLDASNTQHRIRLQGIDAPERKQSYGRASGKYLSEAVAGKHVVIDYSKRDRYKRIVSKVLLSDQDMNLRQVSLD